MVTVVVTRVIKSGEINVCLKKHIYDLFVQILRLVKNMQVVLETAATQPAYFQRLC